MSFQLLALRALAPIVSRCRASATWLYSAARCSGEPLRLLVVDVEALGEVELEERQIAHPDGRHPG